MKDVLRKVGKMVDNLDKHIQVGSRIAGFINQGLGSLVEHVERKMARRSKHKPSERIKPEMEVVVNSEGIKRSECKRQSEKRAKMGMNNDSSEYERSRERTTNLGKEDDLEGMLSKLSNGGAQSLSSTGQDSMCRPIPYESICPHQSDCLSRDNRFSANVCGREGSGVTILPFQACCSSSPWIVNENFIILLLMLFFAISSWCLPMNLIRRKLEMKRNDRRLANALLESKIHPSKRQCSESNNRENIFPKRELFNAQCHCGKLSCSVRLSSYGCHSWRGTKHIIEAFFVPKCVNSEWLDSPLQFPFIPLPASALRLTTAESEGTVYLCKDFAGKLSASFLCTRCGVHLFLAPNLPHTSSKEGAYALLNASCLLRPVENFKLAVYDCSEGGNIGPGGIGETVISAAQLEEEGADQDLIRTAREIFARPGGAPPVC